MEFLDNYAQIDVKVLEPLCLNKIKYYLDQTQKKVQDHNNHRKKIAKTRFFNWSRLRFEERSLEEALDVMTKEFKAMNWCEQFLSDHMVEVTHETYAHWYSEEIRELKGLLKACEISEVVFVRTNLINSLT